MGSTLLRLISQQIEKGIKQTLQKLMGKGAGAPALRADVPSPRKASQPICGLIFILALFITFTAATSATLRMAVFGDQQAFWPSLLGQAPKPAGIPSPQLGVQPQSESKSKSKPQSESKTQSKIQTQAQPPDSIRLAILPIEVSRFSESPTCDSCSRLTPNGFEFFLENWARDSLQTCIAASITLVYPEWGLVQAGRPTLMQDLKKIAIPTAHWFDSSEQKLIWRPRDRWLSPLAKKSLTAIGGILGVTHLFWVSQIEIEIHPIMRSMTQGSYKLALVAVLYDVQRSQVEWALRFSDESKGNLDALLEPRFSPLLTELKTTPEKLKAYWSQEPK